MMSPRGSLLGWVLFSDTDGGIEYTLCKYADDTNLSGVAGTMEGMPSSGTCTGWNSDPT